jgi:poly-gamma-glutamate capsule biosynthesis protein CapA/YwtB (metallophosphatase superfamily)
VRHHIRPFGIIPDLFSIAFSCPGDLLFQSAMKTIIASFALLLTITFPAIAADRPPEEELTIAAVGDLMLGNRTEPFLKEFGPAYPFADVQQFLGKADVVIGNLESPISTRGTAVQNKKFTLRAGPIAAKTLTAGGFRVVTLANNHMMDFGPLALQDTLTILDENGILYTGAGMDLDDARSPAFLRIKGKTLAFLSYSLTFPLEFFASAKRPGTAPGYQEFVKADIEKARPYADIVVVSFHWSAELLTAAKDYQIALGHQAIEWGADLVLGHHAHVLQELELYKGKLIAYGLGNFVFGSESNRTNTSMILLLTFKGKGLARVEAIPLDVNNYRVKYRPRVLRGKAAVDVLEGINTGSERFKTKLAIEDNRGIIVLPTVATKETTT